jgi:MoxR-like ATPase
MIQRWKKAPGRDRSLYEVMNTDEIDKADPDVPNDLLISLGSQRFRVEDLGREVTVQSRVLKHDRRMIVAGGCPALALP